MIDLGPDAGAAGGASCGRRDSRSHRRLRPTVLKSKGKLSRSYTGEFLADVLARDPHGSRRIQSADERALDEINNFADLGAMPAMPWEVDGRLWHTQTRVGRDGKAVHWDGQILARLVDFIQQHGDFAETNWRQRSIVEVASETKSHGWFLHAITGETWLLKLKFRVRRNTFDREKLLQLLPLKTLNELDEIPRYSNESRIRVNNLAAGWQEIEILAYALDEIDVPAFWQFVQDAVAGYQQRVERVELKLEDHTPWARLGKKWHFLNKGFTPGRRIAWDMSVLEKLHDKLTELAPAGQFSWNHKQIVHLFVQEQREPWVSIQTKKPDAIWLHLTGPKNAVAIGEIAEHFPGSTLNRASDKLDVIHIPLKTERQLRNQHFVAFLQKHLGYVTQV